MCNIKSNNSKSKVEGENRKNVPFETALDLTGFGKNNYFVFFVCCTSLFGSVVELFGLSFITQTAACDLKLTMEQRGLLSGLPMLGIIFTAYFWGYFTDIKGRRISLLVSMSFGFLFSFLSSFSPNFGTMATLKFISITFCSGAYAVAYTLLGETQPKRYRDKMLVLLTCANTITECALVAIAYPILTYSDFQYYVPYLDIIYRPWRLMVILFSLPLAISAICLIFVNESPKYLMSRNKEQEALKVLQEIYSRNTGKKHTDYPVETILFYKDEKNVEQENLLKSMSNQITPLFKKPYRKYTAIVSFLSIIVCFVSNAFAMWLPYIVNKFIQGLDNEELANENFCTVFTHNTNSTNTNREPVITSDDFCDDSINVPTYITIFMFSIGGFILTLGTALVVNVLGKRLVLIIVFTITALCGLILNWIRVPMVGLVVMIIFNYEFLGMGVVPAFIIDIYPTYIRGMAGCLSTMTARLGSFVGIYLTGVIFEPYCELTFYIYSSLIFICAAVTFALPSKPIINNDSKENLS